MLDFHGRRRRRKNDIRVSSFLRREKERGTKKKEQEGIEDGQEKDERKREKKR